MTIENDSKVAANLEDSDGIKCIASALKPLGNEAPLCSEFSVFSIDNQGLWFYQGEPLPTKFSRLFSSILHCIEGEHFLITPVEKLKVSVASTPLLIVDYCLLENSKAFTVTTSLKTQFELADYSLFISTEQGVYVELPRGLKAKLGRACYYRFVEQYIIGDLPE